jgi:hypothetical protein
MGEYNPPAYFATGEVSLLLRQGLIIWAKTRTQINHIYHLGEFCPHCDNCFDALIHVESVSVHPRSGLYWYQRLHHELGECHTQPVCGCGVHQLGVGCG